MLGVVDVVVVVRFVAVAFGRRRLELRLAASPAVQHHDRGEWPGAGCGQRDIDVQRHTVERRHPLRERLRRAEAHAVLRFARMAERRRFASVASGRDAGDRGEQ